MDAQATPIGILIDELADLRIKRSDTSKAHEAAKAAYDKLEEIIIARLLADKVEGGKSKRASVSLNKAIVPTFDSDDPEAYAKLCAYVKKTGYFQLFTRHLSAPAYRELAAISKKGIPGLVPFTKISLNHSTLKEKI